jgi:hypothetical protein
VKRVVLALGAALILVGSLGTPALAIRSTGPAATLVPGYAPPSTPPPHVQPERPTRNRDGHPAAQPPLPDVTPAIQPSVAAPIYLVDTAGDPTTGTSCAPDHTAGTCSLRAAVAAANAEASGVIDTIVIPAGMAVELTQRVTLDLTHSMVISAGAGASVDGQGAQVFNQYNYPAVMITGLTITGGAITGNGGGMYLGSGSLVLNQVTFTGNVAANGGGLYTYSQSQLWVDNSIFSDNIATGALFAISSGPSGILANGNGGGLYLYGSANIQNSVFEGNTAQEGAGIYNYDGDVSVSNCTITHNRSLGFGYGVGIYNDEVMDVTGTTIDHNTAAAGVDGAGMDTEYLLTMSDVVFDSNSVTGSAVAYGVGLYDDGDATKLTNVSFTNTTAPLAAGESVYGGALLSYAYEFSWDGGSVAGTTNGTDGLSNYIEGGAAYLDGSHATITGVTITNTTNNAGPDEYVEGGAIYVNEYTTLQGLTISNTQNTGYAVYGGAFYNDDYATVSGMTITATTNHASRTTGGYIYGGVLYNDGENLIVTNLSVDQTSNIADLADATTPSSSSSYIEGGFLYNDYESTFDGVSVTNINDVASGGAGYVYGGGVFNDEALMLHDFQVVDLSVQVDSYVEGGIFYNDDRLQGTNVTLGSDTVAILGGPSAGTPYANGTIMYNDSQASLTNFTAADITSTVPATGAYAFGIENDDLLQLTNATIARDDITGPTDLTWLLFAHTNSSASLLNTIVASGDGTQNCGFDSAGLIISAGHNLDNGTTCGFGAAGDLTNIDPMVAGLADNGGSVLTAALEVGSPAIDAGSNTGCPPTDARGFSRPQGAACDIGAYEFTPGSTYHPLNPPVRLLDTRSGNGLPGRIGANTPATFQITGRGGVPAGASAVTGNLTVTGASNSWAVYLGPEPVANPTSSTINFSAGETTANGVTVALSGTGSLSATYISTAGNTTDLVFDVTGYFTANTTGDTYHPMTPVRLLDSRVNNGISGKIPANAPMSFSVAGRGGVPANATAVTGNLTVVNETYAWAVYIGPVASLSPTTSTINFNAGDIKANNLTVTLGSGGDLWLTYMSTVGNTTDLVFDVTGYYTADLTGSRFVPLTPDRLLDTRVGNGLSGKINANTPVSLQVATRGGVPANATAVTGNVTVTNPSFAWAIYVGDVANASPGTSNLNFNAGDTRANGVTAPLGTGGVLWLTYMSTPGNTTDLVFDVTGYFEP